MARATAPLVGVQVPDRAESAGGLRESNRWDRVEMVLGHLVKVVLGSAFSTRCTGRVNAVFAAEMARSAHPG